MKTSLKINAYFNVLQQCANIFFPLITYPYVTRVLGSENLGKYNFADSIVQLFLLFASLGIPIYAIREVSKVRDNQTKKEKLCSELTSINLLILIVVYFCLICSSVFVNKLSNYALVIYILSVEIISYVIGRDWLTSAYEDFLFIAARHIVFQTLSLVLIFIFVKQPEDYVRYAVIRTVGASGGYISNLIYNRKYASFRLTRRLNIKKHLKPILLLFASSVALTIYVKSDITILGFFRSDSDVAVYSVASKIYSIIKAVINAIIMVSIPRLSRYLARNELDKYSITLSKLWNAIIAIVMPSVCGCALLSKDILYLIGGKEFIGGQYALSILSISLFFAVGGCLYSQAIMIPFNLEKDFLQATTIAAFTNLILNFIFIPLIGIEGAAVTTLIAEIIIFFVCRYKANVYWIHKIDNSIISVALGCSSTIVVCILTQLFISTIAIRILVEIPFSVLSYFIILILINNCVIKDLFLNDLLKIFRRK